MKSVEDFAVIVSMVKEIYIIFNNKLIKHLRRHAPPGIYARAFFISKSQTLV